MKKFQKMMLMVTMFAIAITALLTNTASATTAATDDGKLTPEKLGISYPRSIGLGSTDVRETVAQIIKVAMGLLGIVAVVIVLIGGFTWMTAGGNEEKVGEAKKWIFAGIIGLAIILSSYAISNFVITRLVDATTNNGNTGI